MQRGCFVDGLCRRDEELVTVAFKVPRSYRDRLDEKAASRHETRSQFMRHALEAALA
ncbi:MAG: ribbon-helix-helix protein, CopG family [Adlercreutzia sp.]|nr:ribbon-helix-helix protein, CopG family [Adlercreutzia sp.]